MYFTMMYDTQYVISINTTYWSGVCYDKGGGMLFIMESLIVVFMRERLFMLSNLHLPCIKVKLFLYYFYTDVFDFVFYFSCSNGCVGR
jgi:hypothetical protein